LNPVGSINSIVPVSKKESLQSNKFSYSFQPAQIPQFILPGKGNKSSNIGLGNNGYLPLPKPNTLLRKDVSPLMVEERLK
jgi:hypothetical protein